MVLFFDVIPLWWNKFTASHWLHCIKSNDTLFISEGCVYTNLYFKIYASKQPFLFQPDISVAAIATMRTVNITASMKKKTKKLILDVTGRQNPIDGLTSLWLLSLMYWYLKAVIVNCHPGHWHALHVINAYHF